MNSTRLCRGWAAWLVVSFSPLINPLLGAYDTVPLSPTTVVELTGNANLLVAYTFAVTGWGGGTALGLGPAAGKYNYGQTISAPVILPLVGTLDGATNFSSARWSIDTDSPSTLTNQIRATANTVGVAAGEKHTLLLKRDGTVYAVGSNSSGQTDVPAGLNGVIAIAAGSDHSLALKADGKVIAWGWNQAGQTNVPPELDQVVAITAGRDYSLALRADGTLRAWGGAVPGSEYDPEEGGAFEPPEALEVYAAVKPDLSKIISIAGGLRHSLALRIDGSIIGWGPWAERNAWTPPTNLGPVVAISAGKSFSLALKPDGTVRAWGNNDFHQLDVPATACQVVAIAAGNYHACALRQNGTLVVWGDNAVGQTLIPVGLTNVVALAAGGFHCEILTQTRPTLSGERISGGHFGCDLNIPAGQLYRIEGSIDLIHWDSIEVDLARPGWLSWQSTARTHGAVFYRVRPLWSRSEGHPTDFSRWLPVRNPSRPTVPIEVRTRPRD